MYDHVVPQLDWAASGLEVRSASFCPRRRSGRGRSEITGEGCPGPSMLEAHQARRPRRGRDIATQSGGTWGTRPAGTWGHATVPDMGPHDRPGHGATRPSRTWGHATVPDMGPHNRPDMGRTTGRDMAARPAEHGPRAQSGTWPHDRPGLGHTIGRTWPRDRGHATERDMATRPAENRGRPRRRGCGDLEPRDLGRGGVQSRWMI